MGTPKCVLRICIYVVHFVYDDYCLIKKKKSKLNHFKIPNGSFFGCKKKKKKKHTILKHPTD